MTKEQELNNLIPKIKSQVKQWRGKISTDVQNQIFEVINEMITAQDKIAELKKERDIRDLEQQAKGIDSAIAELTICYRVALDEHKDYEDAEVLEGLIDRLQALKEGK
tara:strand:+ start:526 stop:849 length:324 start_codon:yes stop_codon:yes gene_type:complete